MGYNDVKARLAATVFAGVFCNIITNPIWVVRTRLMVQYLHHENTHYKRTAPFHVMKEMVEKVQVWWWRKESGRCSREWLLRCFLLLMRLSTSSVMKNWSLGQSKLIISVWSISSFLLPYPKVTKNPYSNRLYFNISNRCDEDSDVRLPRSIGPLLTLN